MVTDRDRDRARKVALALVDAHLDAGLDLRRHVILALRGAGPLAVANLVEVLVSMLGDRMATEEKS